MSWTAQALLNAAPAEIVVACRSEERATIRAAFGLANHARFPVRISRALPDKVGPISAPPLRFIENANSPRETGGFPVVLVEGGATRQDSVLNAVRAAQSEWILVHDAARPCVSQALIESTLAAARASGAAIAALPVSDTVKRAAPDGFIAQTLDRNEIWLAQTPQVFRREPFLAALQSAQNDGWQGTDCASIMERAGHRVALVRGEANNLKVTYAADLERAAAILIKAPG